jgi:hypothetical protein
MDTIVDYFAHRAGEEFFRSGRAATDEARTAHRRRAERYANLVWAVRGTPRNAIRPSL